jgi:hypothetical protein
VSPIDVALMLWRLISSRSAAAWFSVLLLGETTISVETIGIAHLPQRMARTRAQLVRRGARRLKNRRGRASFSRRQNFR